MKVRRRITARKVVRRMIGKVAEAADVQVVGQVDRVRVRSMEVEDRTDHASSVGRTQVRHHNVGRDKAEAASRISMRSSQSLITRRDFLPSACRVHRNRAGLTIINGGSAANR